MKEETITSREICDAIANNTAFEEEYKGWTERVLCEEERCLEGYKKRDIENRCIDKKERYICPLHKGPISIKKLFI